MAKQKKAGKKKSNIPDITNAGPSDHAKLKATVAEIVRIAGFKCDTEVHLKLHWQSKRERKRRRRARSGG
jgi:hypothetical protein